MTNSMSAKQLVVMMTEVENRGIQVGSIVNQFLIKVKKRRVLLFFGRVESD